jgi:hypothetical protein
VKKLTPALAKKLPELSRFTVVMAQSREGVPDAKRRSDAVFEAQVQPGSLAADGRSVKIYLSDPGSPFRFVDLQEEGGVLRGGTGGEPVYVYV